MPEKTSTSASFTLHYEKQEKLVQLSEDTPRESSCDGEEEGIEEITEDDYESDFDDENLPDQGEILGFRITGGTDFFMPITIFHVKENSRAEKANLKLGDVILSINGRSTEDMTLMQANRRLARGADGDVTLIVAKFNPNYDDDASDDDEELEAIEEVVLEGPVSLQKKLQMMQQQLLDMTDIPAQIQSKLSLVTKALEQFILDPEAASMEREVSHESDEKQFSTIEDDKDDDEVVVVEEEEEEANEENFEIEHSTRETSYSYEELVYDEEEPELLEEEEGDDDDDEGEMTEEKLQEIEERKKKNEKIRTLQNSWQKLCDNQKTIHKRSNCHLVPSTAILHNKINQLNTSKVISFYECKRRPSSD